jgi:hypothetical protein
MKLLLACFLAAAAAQASQLNPIPVNGIIRVATGDGGYAIQIAADDTNLLLVSMEESNSSVGGIGSACTTGPTAGGILTINGVTDGPNGPALGFGACASVDAYNFEWTGSAWNLEGMTVQFLGYVVSTQIDRIDASYVSEIVILSSVAPPIPTPEPSEAIGVGVALLYIEHVRRTRRQNLVRG